MERFEPEAHMAAESRERPIPYLSVSWRLDLLWERQIRVFDRIHSLCLCLTYPREKSQLPFQDNPDVQFCNTILGI